MANKTEKRPAKTKSLREQILNSTIASFKIEGINISNDIAIATLKKIEFKLGK